MIAVANAQPRNVKDLFRENLEDINQRITLVDPFNLNEMLRNGGSRFDLTDSLTIQDAVRRTLGPAFYLQSEKEKEENELYDAGFKYFLDGGNLKTLRKNVDDTLDDLRGIATENRQRQQERAETARRKQAADASPKASFNKAASKEDGILGRAKQGLKSAAHAFSEAKEFVGDRIDDAGELAGRAARKAGRVAGSVGEAVAETSRKSFNKAADVAGDTAAAVGSGVNAVADTVSTKVSGAVQGGKQIISKIDLNPFN